MTPITPDAPPEGSIHCEQRGALWLIGINRPAKRNGFTPAMFRQLGEAYTRLDDDADLRVGLLHAFGAHFTAGLDLPTIAPLMQRGEKAVPLGWWTRWTWACPATAGVLSPWWWRSKASPTPWALS